MIEEFNESIVKLVQKFEEDYESAIKYLLDDGFEKYNVSLDFIVDHLGADSVRYRVDLIKQLSQDEIEQINEYKNGAKTKTWMLNRCNLKYIVDNNLYSG